MKVKRDSFLYMAPHGEEEKFAQCGTCRIFMPGKEWCAFLNIKTSAGDSCGLYAYGQPSDDQAIRQSCSEEEAGFYKGQVRCINCAAFDGEGGCHLYEKLNQTLPSIFDLDKKVEKFGCCNGFHPKGGDDALDAEWHEQDHPRGQPKNAGQFVKGSGHSGRSAQHSEHKHSHQTSSHNSHTHGHSHVLEHKATTDKEKREEFLHNLNHHFLRSKDLAIHPEKIDKETLKKLMPGKVESNLSAIGELLEAGASHFERSTMSAPGIGPHKELEHLSKLDYEVLKNHFYAAHSKPRKDLSEKIKHVAGLIPEIVKEHSKFELDEYKNAGKALVKIAHMRLPDHEEIHGLRHVAANLLITGAVAASGGHASIPLIALNMGETFIGATLAEHAKKIFLGGLRLISHKVYGTDEEAELSPDEIKDLQNFFLTMSDVIENLDISEEEAKKLFNPNPHTEDSGFATDPPVSEAQRRAMFAAASGHSNIGIPTSVGKEFVDKDSGGKLPTKAKDMNNGDWRGLLKGIIKFFMEEAQEPEHSEDEVPAMQPQTATRPNAAGVMLVDPNHRILFGRRKGADHEGEWSIPAGHLERGEQPAHAAQRETWEEVGKHVKFDNNFRLLDYDNDFHTYYQPIAGQFNPEPNGEFSEFRWELPEKAPTPLHPGLKKTLDAMFVRAKDAEANPHGTLSTTTREEVDSTKHREDMPEDAFLGPDRTYPIKEKREGVWKYTKPLLEAAERRAVMQGRRDIARRAHAILEREFGLKTENV